MVLAGLTFPYPVPCGPNSRSQAPGANKSRKAGLGQEALIERIMRRLKWGAFLGACSILKPQDKVRASNIDGAFAAVEGRA
jgi:hypothetical protein